RMLVNLFVHDHFFDHTRLFVDDRLFDGLGHLDDLLLRRGGEISIRGRAIDWPAFDRDLLLTQAHRFLHRVLGDPAVDAHVAVLHRTFAHGDVFFHHRNPDLRVLRATLRGAWPPLRAGGCRRRGGRRPGVGRRPGPALLLP